MTESPRADVRDDGPPSRGPRTGRSPLTVVAIVAAAVLVLGGGSFFAALFITQQQQFGRLSHVEAAHPNTSASASASADASSTAADLQSAKTAIDQAVAAVLAAHTANWNDINGKWCDSHGCITIVDLQNTGDSSTYVHDRGQDSHGCLWGAASGQEDVFVTYCPQGDAFVDPADDCVTPGDVTRDRLFVRRSCGEPYYRG